MTSHDGSAFLKRDALFVFAAGLGLTPSWACAAPEGARSKMATYPALRAKRGRCVLGYLVAVPLGGTRFGVMRSGMAFLYDGRELFERACTLDLPLIVVAEVGLTPSSCCAAPEGARRHRRRTQHSAPKEGAACWAILSPSRGGGTGCARCGTRGCWPEESVSRPVSPLRGSNRRSLGRAEALGRDDKNKEGARECVANGCRRSAARTARSLGRAEALVGMTRKRRSRECVANGCRR